MGNRTNQLDFEWEELPNLPNSQRQSALLPKSNELALPHIGLGGPICGVQHDLLLVGGGANFPEHGLTVTRPNRLGKVYWDEVFLMDLRTRSWHPQSLRLPKAMAYAACLSLPEGILVLGGEGFPEPNGSACAAVEIFSDVFLIEIQKDCAALKIVTFPSLPKPLSYVSATVVGRTVFAQGNSEIFSLDLDDIGLGWKSIVGHPTGHRTASLLAGINGKLIVAGGRASANTPYPILRDAYAYDPISDLWQVLPDMNQGAVAGIPFSVANRFFVVVGGDGNEARATVYESLDRIRQQHTKGTAEMQALSNTTTFLHDHHCGFNTQIQVFDSQTRNWFYAGYVPGSPPVTTPPVYWGTNLVVVSGEVSPGKRTPKIWLLRPGKREFNAI